MYANNYAGIDLGTRFIKTDKGEIFPSGISSDIKNMANHVMTIDGKSYMMELFNENVNYDFNLNKTLNVNAKLNFIYGLYKNTVEDLGIYKGVIVGLPASQCTDSNVTEFKKILTIDNDIIVDVNGNKKNLLIDEIEIVPEGSTAYYAIDYEKYNKRKTLILDWGGISINEHLFHNDELVESDTEELGSLKIYKDFASEINSKYGTNVKLEEMDDILNFGLSDNGKIYSVKDIKETIKEIALDYCRKVYKNLKLKWSVNTIPYISMVGGTSIIMTEYLCEYIPHIHLENNAQILSAKGMGILARMCFGGNEL